MAKKKKKPGKSNGPKLRPVRSSDYLKSPRGLWGGRVEEFPQPVAWYWPRGTYLRRVECKITSWVGFSSYASHYYATVEEEDNYAWDGERWAKPHDSPASRRYYRRQCRSEAAALRYINLILKKFFPIDKYVIGYSDSKPPPGAKYLTYTGD